MGSVDIVVARHGVSMEDVFTDLDDGGAYWVVENARQCWLTKDGRWVGEVMADELDWDGTKKESGIGRQAEEWRYLWHDAKRDRELAALSRKKRKAVDVERKLWLRDYDLTLAALKTAGLDKPSDEQYRKHVVVGDDHMAVKAKIQRIDDEIYDYHRAYIRSRRTPVALAVYGNT